MNYLDRIQPRIDAWKERAGRHKWMTVNNSSWHMSVFPRFHDSIEEVLLQLLEEKEDGMSYSSTSVVWDLEADKAVYVWHELDELPLSNPDERAKILNLRAEEKRIKEEKALRLAEEKLAEEKRAYETKIAREDKEAKEYIKDCIAKEEQPIPFYQYEI